MNGFFGLALLDLIVIGLYFGVVLYIGFRAMKKVKGQEDFFLGGRSFGKFLQTFSMFGQAGSSLMSCPGFSPSRSAGLFRSGFGGHD
jgi:Na+/proline symporter